jgi:hypothetical protein
MNIIEYIRKDSSQSYKSLCILAHTYIQVSYLLPIFDDDAFLFLFSFVFLFFFPKHRLIINHNHHFFTHISYHMLSYSLSPFYYPPPLRYISVNAINFFSMNKNRTRKETRNKKLFEFITK